VSYLRFRFSRQQWLSFSLLGVGVALLLYVSIQYGTMYREQKRLAEEWQQQNQVTQSPAEPVSNGLTRLVIPKIHLDAVVVEGTSHHQLLVGPGHIENTAAPGGNGNDVITGHRDTFFRHIYELKKGDIVELQRNGATFQYEVTDKKVVDPADVSVIQPTKEAQLTLITCYPTYYIGPAPERLVVTSRLLNTLAPATLKRTSNAGTP
jgi:LPXTG-site transpeptidase (sortase) family protein